MKILIALLIAAFTISTFAQEPVYKFSFDDTDNMTFSGNTSVTIFTASELVKPMLESNLQKKIKAADHVSGIMVNTENPDMAIQEIMQQISRKTGEKIYSIHNSKLGSSTPTKILMGVSPSSVWHAVLSPSLEEGYVLTISYFIEEKDVG